MGKYSTVLVAGGSIDHAANLTYLDFSSFFFFLLHGSVACRGHGSLRLIRDHPLGKLAPPCYTVSSPLHSFPYILDQYPGPDANQRPASPFLKKNESLNSNGDKSRLYSEAALDHDPGVRRTTAFFTRQRSVPQLGQKTAKA